MLSILLTDAMTTTDIAVMSETPAPPPSPNQTRARRLILEAMNRGFSQADIARAAKIHPTTLSNIFNLKQDPEGRTLEAIRAAIATMFAGLVHDQGNPPFAHDRPPWIRMTGDASRQDPNAIGHDVRLRSFTSAGEGKDFQDNIFADVHLPSAFIPVPEWGLGAFRISGDSMEPYLRQGDIVYVGEHLQHVRTGDILVVSLKTGEVIVKKLRIIDAETWELIPVNPNVERTVVKAKDIAWYAPVLGRWEPMHARREVPWREDFGKEPTIMLEE
jgi:SOS-response transcriptional repressor LexA